MARPPIPLRAHSALCLLGFRGEGYSEAFVDELTALHHRLARDPGQEVRLLASPDTLCGACPHLGGGCTLQGPEHEEHMRAQDLAVLGRLGLEVDAVVPWREVLVRIRQGVAPADLPILCTTCPWLSLGWCAEGLQALSDGNGV